MVSHWLRAWAGLEGERGRARSPLRGVFPPCPHAGTIISRDDEMRAMQIIAEHCGGRYQVTDRSGGGRPTIDAVCVR